MGEKKKLLEKCRVLDLSNELGFLCGKIFGDLGADVIKIEPPGGDPSRNVGAYYKDIPDPEKNLYWFSYNHNKRGVTLDIETANGQEIFKKLVQSADILIETFPPGYLAALGLGYDVLSKIRPELVMTSITPFGQTGPYKDYKGSDLTFMAMSGFMSLVGEPDRPPVRVTVPQSCMWTGMHAAAGTMMAYYHRGRSGEGQQVDVSAQASLLWACSIAPSFYDYNREVPKRAGVFITGRSITGAKMRAVEACKDGYVNYIIYGGPAGIRTSKRMTEWMENEGIAPDTLKNKDWSKFNISTVTQQEIDEIESANNELLSRTTRREFFQRVLEQDMLGYPVATSEDILKDEQLHARNVWQEVEHEDLGEKITYPSFFSLFSSIDCNIWRRAPLIGEHNEEIFTELGYEKADLLNLKRAHVI
ncbi:MAG: CoA transferase [Desulfobacterales bacterium]|nr:CoA transferase [Desulfobacterales bacterium]